LASSFDKDIKRYIQKAAQTALRDNIQAMLGPLNMHMKPYWPLLLQLVGLSPSELPMARKGVETTCQMEPAGPGSEAWGRRERGEAWGIDPETMRVMPAGEKEQVIGEWSEVSNTGNINRTCFLVEVDGCRGTLPALQDKLRELVESKKGFTWYLQSQERSSQLITAASRNRA